MPKYNYDDCKPFTVLSHHNEFVKSRVEIACPFCDTVFMAYIWSTAGCGKTCPECGALHTSMGQACPELKPEDE